MKKNQQIVDALNDAFLVGDGAKAKAKLTFSELKIFTKIFTLFLPLRLVILKLRSRLEYWREQIRWYLHR